jgi:hypothetical protein
MYNNLKRLYIINGINFPPLGTNIGCDQMCSTCVCVCVCVCVRGIKAILVQQVYLAYSLFTCLINYVTLLKP